MKNKLIILSKHLSWHLGGFTFDNILAIQNKLHDENIFSEAGTNEISKHIGNHASSAVKLIEEQDLEKITYIIIDEQEFDGNLDFISKCTNIEQIVIKTSSKSPNKIANLSPLQTLKKLRLLHLVFHNVSDLAPLSGLENLEDIDLLSNPIKSIKPLINFGNLKNVRISEAEDEDVFELLKNSNNAIVDYYSKEFDVSFKAYWIKDWAFKTTHYQNYTTIYICIGTIMPDAFEGKLKSSGIDYISLLKNKSKEIARSLLSEKEELIGDPEFNYDEFKILNGKFEFKVK